MLPIESETDSFTQHRFAREIPFDNESNDDDDRRITKTIPVTFENEMPLRHRYHRQRNSGLRLRSNQYDHATGIRRRKGTAANTGNA
jgi:hypothetical protein